jgi:hypothetical protein
MSFRAGPAGSVGVLSDMRQMGADKATRQNGNRVLLKKENKKLRLLVCSRAT